MHDKKAYRKKYYTENKDAENKQSKEYKETHKEEIKGWWVEYYKKNAEKRREYARQRNKDQKELVYNHYGRKCCHCGIEDMRVLTIDHINNDGAAHRKKLFNNGGNSFNRWLCKNNFPEGFQTLCRNCNWIKYLESK